MKTVDILPFALSLAAAGLKPVPMIADGKRPACKGWQGAASLDPDKVRIAFAKAPHADALGVATGGGVFVIDLDRNHKDGEDGVASFAGMIASHGAGMDLPRGPRVLTPGGGVHLHFAAPQDRKARNRTALAPGVDVRGEGGVAMVAPSARAGVAYRWEPDPWIQKIPMAPNWLLDLVAPDEPPPPPPAALRPFIGELHPYARAALSRELANVAGASKGTRNDSLFRAAARLAGLAAGGWLPADAVSVGLLQAAEHCGLQADDGVKAVQTTIASGLRAGLQRPRSIPQGGVEMVDPLTASLAAFPVGSGSWTAKTDKTDETQFTWGTPDRSILSWVHPPAPPLPGDLFCPAWTDWIAAAAESKGAPVDYVAGAVLAAAGSLIGNARWSSPWQDWSEPPVLWVALVGEPSFGKTPAINAVLGTLRTVENKVRQHDETFVEAWRSRRAEAKADGLDFEEPRPHVTRLEVSDSTIERLGTIASLQPKGVFLVADELAALIANLGRYNGGDDAPFWLKAYTGQFHAVERQSYTLRIDHLSIAVLGGIQPDRLNELLLKRVRDGFLARFLPIWPAPAPLCRPTRVIDAQTASHAFSRLYGCRMVEELSGPRPRLVPWTEDARKVMDAARIWVRERESLTEGLLKDLLGKTPGLVARLALILTYLDWAIGPDAPEPYEIDRASAERARRFVQEYSVPMAERAYAQAAVPKEERAAQVLARLIIAERLDGFTSRDIARRERAVLRSPADIEAALDILIQAHWLKPEGGKPGPRGGRPTVTYPVNPAVWGFGGIGGFGG